MTPHQHQAVRQAREALSDLIWAASERDKRNRIRQFDEFMDNARAALTALSPVLEEGNGGVEATEIAAIAQRLHTQDNRITAHPLFAVQQKRTIGGLDPDYAENTTWVDYDGEVPPEEAARLDELDRAGEPLPEGARKVGFIEIWEFVTACFTEQGCKDFIARNGHNLKEPRIYAYSGYRNREFIAVREWLMEGATPTQPPAAAPAVMAEGWMPIETAPKGVKVLVAYLNRAKKWRTVCACYYLPQTLELSFDFGGDGDDDGFAPEGWYEESESSEAIHFTEEPPTHWMPLPPPPVAQSKEQQQ